MAQEQHGNIGGCCCTVCLIGSLSRQLAEAQRALKETSDALLTVAPLGGSECFRQVAGGHYADPFFLGQRIQKIHETHHDAMKRAIRSERALAEAQGVIERVRRCLTPAIHTKIREQIERALSPTPREEKPAQSAAMGTKE